MELLLGTSSAGGFIMAGHTTRLPAANRQYLEGVFLPFTQIRDLPSTSHSTSLNSATALHPIPVRHILLSGFLIHIVLPLVPRLIPLVSASTQNGAPPSASDLQRILQMSLVLSTQARFSSFLPGHERRDEEIRLGVEDLGKTVRRRMQRTLEDVPSPTKRPDSTINMNRISLQRGQSFTNGRYRRKGWRASSNFGQTWGIPSEGSQPMIARQQSDTLGQIPEQKWGRPRVDEEDEEEATPGQSFAYPRNTVRDDGYSAAPSTMASTAGGSTFTAGASTMRGGDSVATTFDLSQKTPQAETYAARRRGRTMSAGSSDLTPLANVMRR